MTDKIRFEPGAQYFYNRVPYHFVSSDNHHAYFRREDGADAIERFSWEELREIVGGPNWECRKRSITVHESKGCPDPYHSIWEEPPKQRKLILNRWFFVCGVTKLYSQGLLKLRPEHVRDQYAQIHHEASIEWAAFCEEFGRRYYCSRETRFAYDASPTSILRWRRLVEAAGGRIGALKDKRGRISKIDIDQESYQFIMAHLREYLFMQRSTGRAVVAKTIMALKLENERRSVDRQPLLETRSKSTLAEWLSTFSRFEVDAARKGLTFAKRKYSSVGKTDRATRPGQVFQVDEWEIDARTLIMTGPIREGLDQKTLDSLPRGRRWMYVVMDVATRYIVGFAISATQNSAAAVRALEMATLDKSELAQAAGAKSAWRGFSFEAVESDTGSAFRSEQTLRAVTETHATYVYPNVGEPKLRGVIERYFGTHAKRAMPYIPGRTFANPQERGDYDTEGLACLTDDQLALIFIRFIVDVYHQSEHQGLFGETPSDALKRLGGTVGLPPQLHQNMRRRAFGIRQERIVTPRGIRFLGIDYDDDALQHLQRAPRSNKIAFYVDPNDLGTISVSNGSAWLEVACSVENFHCVKLLEWIETTKILRARYSSQAELKTPVVFEALTSIRSRATEAMRIMRVLPQYPTAEDLEQLERELYWGLSVIEDDTSSYDNLPAAEDGHGFLIGPDSEPSPDSETEEDAHPDSAPETTIPTSDHDEDWWQVDDDVSPPSEAPSLPQENSPERDTDWWKEEDDT